MRCRHERLPRTDTETWDEKLSVALTHVLRHRQDVVHRPDGLVPLAVAAAAVRRPSPDVYHVLSVSRKGGIARFEVVEHSAYGVWVRATNKHTAAVDISLLQIPPERCLDLRPPKPDNLGAAIGPDGGPSRREAAPLPVPGSCTSPALPAAASGPCGPAPAIRPTALARPPVTAPPGALQRTPVAGTSTGPPLQAATAGGAPDARPPNSPMTSLREFYKAVQCNPDGRTVRYIDFGKNGKHVSLAGLDIPGDGLLVYVKGEEALDSDAAQRSAAQQAEMTFKRLLERPLSEARLAK